MNDSANRVNGINDLAAQVAFAFDPAAIQIGEQTVDVVGTCGVVVPFLSMIP